MAQKPFPQCKYIHSKRGCKHGCTREWKICHFWHQGKCWKQDNAWCPQGYHSKKKRTHNEAFGSDSKDTRQDTSAGKRRADDRRVRSPREDRETRSTWHRSAEYSRGASGPTDAAQTEMQKGAVLSNFVALGFLDVDLVGYTNLPPEPLIEEYYLAALKKRTDELKEYGVDATEDEQCKRIRTGFVEVMRWMRNR